MLSGVTTGENLDRFMNQVVDSEELQTRIGEGIDSDSLIALGAEHGCEFSVDDLTAGAELSEEELDGVAGGMKLKKKIQKWRLKRMEKLAKKTGVLTEDGEIAWNVHSVGNNTTEYVDDGSGDPTKLW